MPRLTIHPHIDSMGGIDRTQRDLHADGQLVGLAFVPTVMTNRPGADWWWDAVLYTEIGNAYSAHARARTPESAVAGLQAILDTEQGTNPPSPDPDTVVRACVAQLRTFARLLATGGGDPHADTGPKQQTRAEHYRDAASILEENMRWIADNAPDVITNAELHEASR